MSPNAAVPAGATGALRRGLRIRLLVGVPFVALGALVAAITFVHWRDARRFEQSAGRAPGRVVQRLTDGDVNDHLVIRFRVDGRDVLARAPSGDAMSYRIGERVTVLYDRRNPSRRIEVSEEPYDSSGGGVPALFLFLVGAGPAGAFALWSRRLRHVMRTTNDGFLMQAGIWRRRDRLGRVHVWLSVWPLDADVTTDPIASYRLLSGQRVWLLPMRGPAVVRGEPRQGGVMIASAGDYVFWPARVARSGAAFHEHSASQRIRPYPSWATV